jgi:predicted metal-dependent phosphoesterase TrpH
MGLADLHIHSIYSWDGTASISAILKHASDNVNLDVIAITDHDEIKGALEAREMASKYKVEVITGSEISTADGHCLALFIDRTIPAGLSLEETVLRVGDQGGICIAAHPATKGTKSLNAFTIHVARRNPQVAQILVGVEVLNSSLLLRRSFKVAEAIALFEGMAWVGNSDAHTLSLVGTGASRFPGTTSSDLLAALIARETRVYYPVPQSPLKIMSHWLKGFALRTAGWVAWNPYPEAPVILGRKAHLGIHGPS